MVEPGCSGNIRFVNCGFWGPVEHNAVLRGSAYVSFSDCYFSNDNQQDPGYADRGRERQAPGPPLHFRRPFAPAQTRQRLGRERRPQPAGQHPSQAGLQSAILEGNNGYYGVKIQNDIGDGAILRDNEPFTGRSQATKAAMKILIIGGTGNISTPITKALMQQGHDLTLFNYDATTAGVAPGRQGHHR